MALPALKTLHDCSNWSTSVEPFIPQLHELPFKVLDVIAGRQGLGDLYLETNPLISGFAVSILVAATTLVTSELCHNYSHIDRLWSLLPTVYILHFDVWARLSGISASRIDAVLAFSSLWSIRLTYNFWRKGGYEIGAEDYRWAIVRKSMPKFAFHLLNIFFISFIQSILLFLLAAPTYSLLLTAQLRPEMTSADWGYLAVLLAFLMLETVADKQQWNFQTAKQQYQKTYQVPSGYDKANLDRGYITSGLWQYSRHPNFAAEQTMWFFLYQWSCYASRVLFSWAAIGSTSLMLLFQASTRLTEQITARKYVDYEDYQSKVGMLLPKPLSGFSATTSSTQKPKQS